MPAPLPKFALFFIPCTCYGLYLDKGRLGMVLNLGYQAYYFPGSFLVYLAYSMLRKSVEEAENIALYQQCSKSGFISVPLSFFLIRLWRSAHPLMFGGNMGENGEGLEGLALQLTCLSIL